MPWKYLPVLNAMLQILSTVGLGGLLGRLGILDAKLFVPASVCFVFYVALPCLVIRVCIRKGDAIFSFLLSLGVGLGHWNKLVQ